MGWEDITRVIMKLIPFLVKATARNFFATISECKKNSKKILHKKSLSIKNVIQTHTLINVKCNRLMRDRKVKHLSLIHKKILLGHPLERDALCNLAQSAQKRANEGSKKREENCWLKSFKTINLSLSYLLYMYIYSFYVRAQADAHSRASERLR